MQLGLITSCDVDGIRYAASKGMKNIEFCYNVDNDISVLENRLPDLKAALKENHASLASLGRWGTKKIAADGSVIESELQDTYHMIDLAAALGSPVFHTGVNFEDGTDKKNPHDSDHPEKGIASAIEFLKLAVDYGKSKGVKISVYNCDWCNFVREPKFWFPILHSIPELGIKYDPSHCINCGNGRYLEEIRDFGSRFYHFHIKGTLNIDGDHVDDPPAGLDMINWRAVLGMLYAVGYDGVLSIEPHSGIWKGELGEKGLDYTIRYFSEMIL